MPRYKRMVWNEPVVTDMAPAWNGWVVWPAEPESLAPGVLRSGNLSLRRACIALRSGPAVRLGATKEFMSIVTGAWGLLLILMHLVT